MNETERWTESHKEKDRQTKQSSCIAKFLYIFFTSCNKLWNGSLSYVIIHAWFLFFPLHRLYQGLEWIGSTLKSK